MVLLEKLQSLQILVWLVGWSLQLGPALVPVKESRAVELELSLEGAGTLGSLVVAE